MPIKLLVNCFFKKKELFSIFFKVQYSKKFFKRQIFFASSYIWLISTDLLFVLFNSPILIVIFSFNLKINRFLIYLLIKNISTFINMNKLVSKKLHAFETHFQSKNLQVRGSLPEQKAASSRLTSRAKSCMFKIHLRRKNSASSRSTCGP